MKLSSFQSNPWLNGVLCARHSPVSFEGFLRIRPHLPPGAAGWYQSWLDFFFRFTLISPWIVSPYSGKITGKYPGTQHLVRHETLTQVSHTWPGSELHKSSADITDWVSTDGWPAGCGALTSALMQIHHTSAHRGYENTKCKSPAKKKTLNHVSPCVKHRPEKLAECQWNMFVNDSNLDLICLITSRAQQALHQINTHPTKLRQSKQTRWLICTSTACDPYHR